jgi:hypothetical protein
MRPHTSVRKLALTMASVGAMLITLMFTTAAPAAATSCTVNPLSGSSFEGGDGNLTSECATDWNSLSTANIKINIGIDLPSGSADNSFGKGTKEDSIAPTIVTGSIPPNKNDLTRFYEASEIGSNSDSFVYLAWERLVNIGSADMDFEINKLQCNPSATPSNCSTNGVTPVRSAGDVLVLFEFGGSGTPTIQISRWVASGAGSLCEASSTTPCWGAVTTLSASEAQAAVNTVTVTDTHLPSSGSQTLTAGLFGETAVDLTAAGVFPAGTCQHFGSAYTKARSSGSSFDSELKDFIAPIPVNISNCGEIRIHKTTIPAGGTNFGYTTTGGLSPSTFSLNDAGTQDYTNVPQGQYSVSESSKTGWDFVSLNCSASGSGTSDSTSNATANITIAAGGLVDCTYTNHVHASPTIATTLSANTVNTGDSVHDSATLTGATSDAGGTVTYNVYTDNACTTAATFTGTLNPKTVTNGVVPDSDTISFPSAGTYYWQAVYSGDTHNDSTQSSCGSEVLVVKTNPSISTTLSAASTAIGQQVHDSATLTGATSDAGGTVTYSVFTDTSCTIAATFTGTLNPGAGGKEIVTNGVVPDSGAISFPNAGTYYWQAKYSGDAKNNPATSPCGSETLVVSPNNPSATTTENLLPNDSATITGLTSNAGGTITFNLYQDDNTCSGTPVYTSGQMNVSGSQSTYNTSNTTFFVSGNHTWYWQAVYSGDSNNTQFKTSCSAETFTIVNN